MNQPISAPDLARALDCLTEEEFCALCDIEQSTAEAWRKRHKGPDYALVGNRVLYPLAKVREFIDSEVRTLRRDTRRLPL